ncbi:hypothetical protein LCGC14_2411530, partial [marine sediment metagenome]
VFVDGTDKAYELGDSTFQICGWLYLGNNSAQRVAISRWLAGAGDRNWVLDYLNTSNRFRFIVYKPGNVAVTVVNDALGVPALNRWYFVSVYHDAVADEIGIRTNLGVYDTMATGGALQLATGAELGIGTRDQGLLRWIGRLSNIGIWTRRLEEIEHAWLYNQGRGRNWPLGDGRYMPLAHNRRLRRRRIA